MSSLIDGYFEDLPSSSDDDDDDHSEDDTDLDAMSISCLSGVESNTWLKYGSSEIAGVGIPMTGWPTITILSMTTLDRLNCILSYSSREI